MHGATTDLQKIVVGLGVFGQAGARGERWRLGVCLKRMYFSLGVKSGNAREGEVAEIRINRTARWTGRRQIRRGKRSELMYS